jgi:hypothetical protein
LPIDISAVKFHKMIYKQDFDELNNKLIFQISNDKCPASTSIEPLLPKPHHVIDEPWIIEKWLGK